MTELTAGTGLRHLALFYLTPAAYQAALAQFAREAADRGEHVLIAVPHEQAELLRGVLAGEKRVAEIIDMTWLGRNPARIIPVIMAFAQRHEGSPVTFVAETAWPGRADPELAEVARHEALVNVACADLPITVMCPYDRGRLPGPVLDDAALTHPGLLEDGLRRPSESYLGPYGLPGRCYRPLPAPPPGARMLPYESDLRPVREQVAALARPAGLASSRAADLVLAVSEVAANTLRHTTGGGTLTVWRDEAELLCEVSDGGHIADPLAGRYAPRADRPGGHGLWLVHQVCDLVEVRTGPDGTTVRMHMAVAGGGSRQAGFARELWLRPWPAPMREPRI